MIYDKRKAIGTKYQHNKNKTDWREHNIVECIIIIKNNNCSKNSKISSM